MGELKAPVFKQGDEMFAHVLAKPVPEAPRRLGVLCRSRGCPADRRSCREVWWFGDRAAHAASADRHGRLARRSNRRRSLAFCSRPSRQPPRACRPRCSVGPATASLPATTSWRSTRPPPNPFYRELFGWDFSSEPRPNDGYRMVTFEGQGTGGRILPFETESGRSHWMGYIQVTGDLEEHVARARRWGRRSSSS